MSIDFPDNIHTLDPRAQLAVYQQILCPLKPGITYVIVNIIIKDLNKQGRNPSAEWQIAKKAQIF